MDFSGLVDAFGHAQGGGGGVESGTEEGLPDCVVDHFPRSNDRSVGRGNSREPIGKGPSLGSLQGIAEVLQGPPGTLQGPEEIFEATEIAMADLTLSRTPHSLKKVMIRKHIFKQWQQRLSLKVCDTLIRPGLRLSSGRLRRSESFFYS